jgi:YhcH/YjgK/YiaL family protein
MYQETKLVGIKPPEVSLGNYATNHADYFAHPEKYALEPFRIFGNLYYVGDRKACPYLIDTGDGLILIDTGYGHEKPSIPDNIRTLGFRVEDVKIIIHSHGHFDHFGSGNALRSLTGAKVYMSAVDTQLIRQRPDRALVQWGPCPNDPICWPDVEIGDGVIMRTHPVKSHPTEGAIFEAHHRYIDIHFVIYGGERIGYADLKNLRVQSDEAEKDLVLLEGEGAFLPILPGYFMITFPDDAHSPAAVLGDIAEYGKIVAKVPVN